MKCSDSDEKLGFFIIMETSNKISDTKKFIPIFGKRKSKEKGYMNFENSETQKNFFKEKEKIDEEIEEKAFWAGLLGLGILGTLFVGSIYSMAYME